MGFIGEGRADRPLPLLRPFALGFCIMFFPSLVLGTMNTILSPVVKGTEQLVAVQEGEVTSLKAKRDKLQEEALRTRDRLVSMNSLMQIEENGYYRTVRCSDHCWDVCGRAAYR